MADASVPVCKSCVEKLISFDEHYTIAMTVKEDLNNLYKAFTEIEHIKIESNVEPEIFEFISMEEHAMSGNQPSSSGKLKCNQPTAHMEKMSTQLADGSTTKVARKSALDLTICLLRVLFVLEITRHSPIKRLLRELHLRRGYEQNQMHDMFEDV